MTPTNDPSSKYLRSLLVEAREKAGLTQVAVAKALKKPQSFVSKYECGERALDVLELIQICRVLGISVKTLIAKLEARL